MNEEPGVERRLAAILAADVVGYSRLMEANEASTHARLKALRKELIDPAIARHKGRIVKLTGDGALVEFPSAVGAVLAAAEIQRTVAEHEAGRPANERIAFRIGINLGDVIIEDDDIYGDGVNVAARLEALAEPGGICVSRTVYNQVKGKVDFGFAPAGEHRVKNISEPVSVYRVLLDGVRWQPSRRASASWRRGMIAAAAALAVIVAGGALWTFYPRPEPAAEKAAPLEYPSMPSIAVLPFTNLNDDPEEELFIDGLTNDVITDLSKFSTLFVIAANSTFQYKRKAVNVQDVARDLGVRYVLEGSVQRSGDTLRINAQLIDATTGAHVWAERYDRAANDFFAVQNEITRSIVGVVSPLAEGRGKLQKQELERIGRTATENLQAYDYFLQGIVYMDKGTRDDNLRSREMFEKALELDPGYARAYGKNTWTYLLEYANGWTDEPERAFQKAMEVANTAVAVDPNEPWAHYGLGSAYIWRKQYDLGIQSFQRAHELNPNEATILADYAWALGMAGRPDEALPLIEKAIRLNPYHPPFYKGDVLWRVHFVARRYEEALDALVQVTSPYPARYRRLAATYPYLNRMDEARAAMAKFRELEPQASIELYTRTEPFRRKDDLERYLDGLRRAGLPEKSPVPGT
jgi:adenylate cyclase